MPQPLPTTITRFTADGSGNFASGPVYLQGITQGWTAIITQLTMDSLSPAGEVAVLVNGRQVANMEQATFAAVAGSIPLAFGDQLSFSGSHFNAADVCTVDVNGYQLLATETSPPLAIQSPLPNPSPSARTALASNVAGVGNTLLVAAAPAGQSLVVYDLIIVSRLNPSTANASVDDQNGAGMLFMPAGISQQVMVRDLRPGVSFAENGTQLTLLNAHVGAGGGNFDMYATFAYV